MLSYGSYRFFGYKKRNKNLRKIKLDLNSQHRHIVSSTVPLNRSKNKFDSRVDVMCRFCRPVGPNFGTYRIRMGDYYRVLLQQQSSRPRDNNNFNRYFHRNNTSYYLKFKTHYNPVRSKSFSLFFLYCNPFVSCECDNEGMTVHKTDVEITFSIVLSTSFPRGAFLLLIIYCRVSY